MSRRSFSYVAAAEATSFLALLIASAIKHSGGGATGVMVLGWIHGLLFISYVVNVFAIRATEDWDVKTTFWILVGAVIPFGGYVVDLWLSRRPRALD